MGLFEEVFGTGTRNSSKSKSSEQKAVPLRNAVTPRPRSTRQLVDSSRLGRTTNPALVTGPSTISDVVDGSRGSKYAAVKQKVEPTKRNATWFGAPKTIETKSVSKITSASSLNRGLPKTTKATKGSTAATTRGQTQASSKSEQGQLQGQIREDLTRSSSATNLNAETKHKGAFSRIRNSASKDRLDKLIERKHENKASNNNKGTNNALSPSLESVYEVEVLQKQLNDMAKEKCDLALELTERREELHGLKNEIFKLKMFQEQSNVRIDQLCDENTLLRNRLRDVAHSPLSDNEKQQLLLDSQRHSSAPASIALNLLDDDIIGDITACPTPEWDKHSSGNVSEVSVACLQDKINQMQETHYSTNEELQATLQELTDLQRQLTELQQDNERLLDEKNLMFDSLCRQTERLNDARTEVESLKQLLYRDKDETGQFESIVDREQKLVHLLKSAQDERESLLVKQEQLNNEFQETRSLNNEHVAEINQLTERVTTLESILDAKHAEHRQIDQELAIAKDQCSGRQIEINRLTDILDNARTKIYELEQERALNDKSEIDELLDNARKEKDCLESEVANLKEQVARSRNETEKLKEQVSILQEECKVIRNNAKCTQSELEYKCEKLSTDKANLSDQLQQLQDAANELQVQAQCQLEDKRQLSTVLSETQRNLSAVERKNVELENELDDVQKLRKEENEEWEKFQDDLLTSVRVANDFKSEAQQELQKMIMENKSHRDRVRQLEAQIDKMKGARQSTNEILAPVSIPPKVPLNTNNTKMGSDNHYDDRVSASSAETITHSAIPHPTAVKKSTKGFLGLPYIFRRPYKTSSSDSLVSSSSSNTNSDKSFSTVPKRFKLLKTDNKQVKRLSLQEERDLTILNNLYTQIDQNQPDEYLTSDQKYIIKLKDVFDKEANNPKLKPIPKLSKDKVAISKPLLGSVLTNPHLKDIRENTNVAEVETKMSEVEYDFDAVDARPMIDNILEKRVDGFHSNLEFTYYNSGDCSNTARSCSVDNVLFSKSNSTALENQLSNEEKFVIKLKKSVDEMGRKNTLKKKSLDRNKVKISDPVSNSIITNPSLFSILKDPNIRSVNELNKLDSASLAGSSIQFMEVDEDSELQRSVSCSDLHGNAMSFLIKRTSCSAPNICTNESGEDNLVNNSLKWSSQDLEHSKEYPGSAKSNRPQSLDSTFTHKHRYAEFLKGMIGSSDTTMENQSTDSHVRNTSDECRITEINSKNIEMNTSKNQKNSKTFDKCDLSVNVFGDKNKYCTTYFTKDKKVFGVVKYKDLVDSKSELVSSRMGNQASKDAEDTAALNNDSSNCQNDHYVDAEAERIHNHSTDINQILSIYNNDESFKVLQCNNPASQQSANNCVDLYNSDEDNIPEKLCVEASIGFANDHDNIAELICHSYECVSDSSEVDPSDTNSNLLRIEGCNYQIDAANEANKDVSKFTHISKNHQNPVKIIDTIAKDLGDKSDSCHQHIISDLPGYTDSANYTTLDRIAAFHVLNNPPPLRKLSESNSSRPRENSQDFETTRRRFENIIQASKGESRNVITAKRTIQSLPIYQNVKKDQLASNKVIKKF